MTTLLIVEDEKPIRDMFRFALLRTEYTLTEAEDAKSLWQALDQHQPDLILMDWMLPDSSGIELTKRLKQDELTTEIPIIMLTARCEEKDKIQGLNAGADDYVVKPFSPLELLARIKAVLRRSQKKSNQMKLVHQQLIMDTVNHRLTAEGETVEIGPKEYRLLKHFMENPNQVFSRSQLMDRIWGRNTYVEERTVDVHIRRLRKVLAPWSYHKYIQTVRGAGYRFSSQLT
jgi:two-component system phosphate regulon response regulator PhoB